MTHTFKIDRRIIAQPLMAVLADIEELWPEEVKITDFIEIACESQRARQVLGALFFVGEDDHVDDDVILGE